MGIPSYYKKLLEKHPRLVQHTCPGPLVALYFDFNCLIYHVARGPKMPPYPGEDDKENWETQLLDEIQRYIVQVWTEAGKPAEVFLAVDGVVPMAKIRQQRLRRFKSAWLVQEEIREGLRKNEPSWDTNCITPGTAFMDRLNTTLQKLCSLRKGWSVSGSSEPGEGEHKVMTRLRAASAEKKPIAVYGLDADLILLTLLNARSPAFLMRERSEMGIVQTDGLGKEQYSFFSIQDLRDCLVPDSCKSDPQEWIHNYIVGMSLLGNDFLPHSCSITIKNNGHAILCKTLADMWSKGGRLCTKTQEGFWQIEQVGLLMLLDAWAAEEESSMCFAFKKKLQMRGKVTTYNQMERRPLEWSVEQSIYRRGQGEESWSLVTGWQKVYKEKWLQASKPEDEMELCKNYIYGLQWTLDYYTGQRPVPKTWYFTRGVPPLWCDLARYVRENSVATMPILTMESEIQPQEQLAMVLPCESWHLLRNKTLQTLPLSFPTYWPRHFEFLSLGRLWLWECEPRIPVLTIHHLRLHLQRNTAGYQ